MPTQLPILRIHDTDFYVDLRGMQFIQVDQPANCITFDDVQDNETHCLVLFDTATKNAFQGTWADLQQSRTVVEVRLPSLAALDPSTLAALIREAHPPGTDLERAARAFQQITDHRQHPSQKQKRR